MEISNSDEKFIPNIDWISTKYNELNEWLFNGKLGNCLFEVYTKGNGAERSLGHFRLTGKEVKYSKRTRIMYCVDQGHISINQGNFFKYAKPMIGLNGNYKRTEKMWLNTLVHEMCHYYTYMNGHVPVQSHGSEFRNIATFVGQKSNGIFEIKRLCDSENVGELDSNIVAKIQARDEKKKSNMTALLVFRTNGEVQLITTTSKELIKEIINDNNKYICNKILSTNDNAYIEYLWSLGFKHNMRTYRFWPVKGKDLVGEIKKYDYSVLKGVEMDKSYSITNENIKTMVEAVLNNIIGKNDELVDITPNMILSNEAPI